MSQDGDWEVRKAMIKGLNPFNKDQRSILKKMSQDEHQKVSETAEKALDIKTDQESRQELLSTHQPSLAAPYGKAISKQILKLEHTAQDLRKKFGDLFIGVSVFGSTAKGYAHSKSDIDWGIVSTDQRPVRYFQEKMSNSLDSYYGFDIRVNKDNRVSDHPDILFHGLFFGNHQKLAKLQQKTLEGVNENKWDKIREKILEDETNLNKAAERFNMKDQELDKIKQLAALNRVPPTYQEVLKLVHSRVK